MATTINTDHYKEGRKYEPWDVIADWGLGYFLGNALKYISRAGRKDGNAYGQDLMKAITYLQKELDNIGYGRNMPTQARKEDWPEVKKQYESFFGNTLEEAYEQQYKHREEYDPT